MRGNSWDGTYTVSAVVSDTVFQFEVTDTTLDTPAVGRLHIEGAVPDATLRASLQQNRDWFIANGFTRSWMHHAYPFGDFDNAAIQALRDMGYKTGRTTLHWSMGNTYPIQPTMVGVPDPTLYELPVQALGEPETAATALAAVDDAIARNSSIFFIMHDVKETAASNYDTSFAVFDAFIAGLASRRDAGLIDVVSVSEWYSRLAPPPSPTDSWASTAARTP